MKILVYGGRDFNDERAVFRALDKVHRLRTITHVIHGNASGADTLGKRWALINSIPQTPYIAQWNLYGKAAGPMRNKQMRDHGKPNAAVEFPGGAGTANMRQLLEEKGIKIWRP